MTGPIKVSLESVHTHSVYHTFSQHLMLDIFNASVTPE